MIISKTPMRLSLVGGGSDLPGFYRENGGAVVSAAITKYVYLCVNSAFDHKIRISYSKTEEVEKAGDIQHRLVRAILEKLGIENGVEIASIADIPSLGSGLGSSSAFTVGLLHAMYSYKGLHRSQEDLAWEACEVEIDICGDPIGKQDQYGAAVGGIKLIRFSPDGTVAVEPIVMPGDTQLELERSMMMFYTGILRPASKILTEQSKSIGRDSAKRASTARLAAMADELSVELCQGRIENVGDFLHKGWLLKKTLSPGISTPRVDAAYEAARAAGATGGKLLGAGGGGFLVFTVPEGRRDAVRQALDPMPQIEFGIDRNGTSIVFPNSQDRAQ
jgi:D-glycero-alpha-D-manno-heptose-7-phosphate kinase